jgi:hypothetical protein
MISRQESIVTQKKCQITALEVELRDLAAQNVPADYPRILEINGSLRTNNEQLRVADQILFQMLEKKRLQVSVV